MLRWRRGGPGVIPGGRGGPLAARSTSKTQNLSSQRPLF